MYRTDFWTLWEKVGVGCTQQSPVAKIGGSLPRQLMPGEGRLVSTLKRHQQLEEGWLPHLESCLWLPATGFAPECQMSPRRVNTRVGDCCVQTSSGLGE